MTTPLLLVAPQGMVQRYQRMKTRFAMRDGRIDLVRSVRRGDLRQLFPAELQLSMNFGGVPIANAIDYMARDLAEVIAPLPSLACVSGKMKTDADLARAAIKNHIGDNYWRQSRLELQMLSGSDNLVSNGFIAFFIEPNLRDKLPYICVDASRHGYYELDRQGNCLVYAKAWMRSVDDLCAAFPEHASAIRQDKDGRDLSGSTEVELVRWIDDTSVTLFLPQRAGYVLASYQHKLDRPPVWIAERPSMEGEPRGQFDDVVYVQVAKAMMATLQLEAASKAVQAPIILPRDVDELSIGPDAVIQADNIAGIGRAHLELPPNVFAEAQLLGQEIKDGSRYPDIRSGNTNASVITGKGVEALSGTYETQIKGYQMILEEALRNITAMAFEYDEKWWPNESKTINGTTSGESFQVSYTPSTDINGKYDCNVTYGFATGMHPEQQSITLLQLEGAGIISKATHRENLPMPLDALQEERKVNVERFREALEQGVFSLIQSSGQMAAQGQDPSSTIQVALDTIKLIQEGQPVEVALETAFSNKASADQQAQQAAQEQAQAAAAAGGGAPGGPPGPGDPGGGDSGPPPAPGQAGMPPGGQPTMMQLMAGFRGNASTPVNQATISRRQATGTM